MIQLPPHNLDAEQAVLGAVLLADTVMPSLLLDLRLRPEQFYHEQYGEIFRAMVALYDRGAGIDSLTVTDQLAVFGTAEKVSGPAMIDALAASAPAAGNAGEYARIVIDLATWRARQRGGYEVLAAVQDRDVERYLRAETVLRTAEVQQSTTHDSRALADLAFEYINDTSKPTGVVETPWPTLNEYLGGGLRPGDTTLVPAWSNQGKSCVIGGVLEHAAAAGTSAHLYTNEETELDWTLRTVSSMSRVAFQKLLNVRRRPLDEAETRAVMAVLQRLHDLPIGVTVVSGWPVEDIERHIRRYCWGVAAVDIVNRIPHKDTREMDHISLTLNSAARIAGTHLLIACHLNQTRNVTATPPPPTRRDIRETGSLANDANNVLFLHREWRELTLVDGSGSGRFEPGPEGRLWFDKVRNGMLGGVDVALSSRMRFEEWSGI